MEIRKRFRYKIRATCGSSFHTFYVTDITEVHAKQQAQAKIDNVVKGDKVLIVTELWEVGTVLGE